MSRSGARLNAFDVAWMEGLPKDPAEVAEADAIELHRLLLEAEPDSSEARLIAQRFAPVEAHERRVEEHNRAAQAKVGRFPIPPIPDVAKRLLAEAIAAEEPALHPNEAAQRARDALAGAEAARTGQGAPAAL